MNAVFLQEQTLQFTVFKFHLRYCYMVLGSVCASVVSFIIWEIADFEREQELPSGKHYWNIKCKRDSRIGDHSNFSKFGWEHKNNSQPQINCAGSFNRECKFMHNKEVYLGPSQACINWIK